MAQVKVEDGEEGGESQLRAHPLVQRGQLVWYMPESSGAKTLVLGQNDGNQGAF